MPTMLLENKLLPFNEEVKTFTSSGNIIVDYVAARPPTNRNDNK